jgi:hypothetical protein
MAFVSWAVVVAEVVSGPMHVDHALAVASEAAAHHAVETMRDRIGAFLGRHRTI